MAGTHPTAAPIVRGRSRPTACASVIGSCTHSRNLRSTKAGNTSMVSVNELRCHPDGARTPTSHLPRTSDGEIVTRHSPSLANCRLTNRTPWRIASAMRRSGTPSISSSMSIIVPPTPQMPAGPRSGPPSRARRDRPGATPRRRPGLFQWRHSEPTPAVYRTRSPASSSRSI